MLAMLLDGPKHGYALKKRAGLVWGAATMHNNIVYPLLRRFVARGWVTQRAAKGERGQTRQMYALTAAGRGALIERLSEYGEKERRSSEALHARVALFEALDAAARKRILEGRRDYLEGRTGRLRQMQAAMDLGRYGGEVVRFLGEQIRAELRWIERLERMSARVEGGAKRARRKAR